MGNTHEEAFIQAFIEPGSQERYLRLIANPERRVKFLQMLYNPRAVVLDRMEAVASRVHFPDPVEKQLRQSGAGPACYLFSPEPDLDRREMPLREALDLLIMQDRVAVASCISGRLAYWKSELDGFIMRLM